MKNDELRRYPFFGAITALALAFLYVPLLIVAVYSFNADRSITVWGGFSLDWYVKALTNPQLQVAAMNSLIVAVAAATVATLFAFMAALVLVRKRSRRSVGVAFALINLPLAVPEIVTAIGTLLFFVLIGLPLGLTSIMLAHVVFCIPFAYLPLAARLQGIEVAFEEAAADLYATRWETLRYVLIPLMMPGLISGFMLAFIVSIDDFIITSFVAGPGATTLPLAIYGMVRVGFTPEINAIATMMLALSSLTVLASFVFARRGGSKQTLGH
jgi:spermidine/putrescine transport system permease protein